MDGDVGPVTGYYLQQIHSDLPNAVPRIELRGSQMTMGRGIGNNIIWESLQISRRHCIMEYRNQRWMIKDTSTNGMLINSSRMARNVFVPLQENDTISFVPTGSLQYRFLRANSPRKYSPSNIGIHPAIVQNSPIMATLDDSVAEVSPEAGLIKSPKRKTGSGPIDHVNPEKKRKCLHQSSSAVNLKLETVDEDEEEELLDIDEVPSFFIPSTKPPAFFDNDNIKYEHDVLDIASLKGLNTEDVSRITNQFKKYEDRIRKLEDEKQAVVQEQRLELAKVQNQLKSAQSENRVFQEELFKRVMEGLETEFSCCICNEVFINATVIDCGHTFCSHCLGEWIKRKPECPTCRKQVRIQVKHIEVENFITKIHTILSEEIQQHRQQILLERKAAEAKAAADAASAAAAASRQPPPRHRRAHEINGMDLIAEFIGYAHEMLPSIRTTAPLPPTPGVAHGPPEYGPPRHYHHFSPFMPPYPDMMRNRQQATGPSTRRRSVRLPPREATSRGPGPVRGRGAQQVPDMPPVLGEFNLGPGHMDILTVD